jgi:signal transduction histidine kinase
MRERAALIGGKLTVWSEIDTGTEVELCIPVGLAYTSHRRASWLSRVFAGKTKDDSGDSA